MFKTSGGKYVAPQLLENRFKQSRFIEQIMVVGEGEKMPAAIIQPDFVFLGNWAKKKGIAFTNNEELIASEKVIKRIQKEVDEANEDFAKFEKVKQFRLSSIQWTPDSGHLTPTMKLKRKIVKEFHKDLYESIYRP
jgi:long-chain acyl-CoA synthetase